MSKPWLEKIKSGGWLVRWRDHWKVTQSSKTLPTEIQARRYAQMIALQLSQQISFESELVKVMTVRDCAELWLATVPVQADSLTHYRTSLTVFLAAMGDRNLQSIRPLDLGTFFVQRRSELSSYSYSMQVGLIKRLFKFAVDNLMIAVDPAQALRAPQGESSMHRCLSWEEEVQFFAYLAANHFPIFTKEFLVCRDTGMRHMNAVKLLRSALRFDRPAISFTSLKTRIRLELPMTRRLESALRELEPLDMPARLFPHNETTGSAVMMKASKRLGWHVSTHDLRYSFRKRFEDATGKQALAEYCLGHNLKANPLTYYWSRPSPEELRREFQTYDQYQQSHLALVAAEKISDAEIWEELGGKERKP